MPFRYFEDFPVGEIAVYGNATATEEEIVGFARQFDAQPMHIDAEAAKRSFAGGLIASGWGTAALNMRMMVDGILKDSASMGSPGIEALQWLKPVRPGDVLTARRTTLAARASASKPDRGAVTFRFEIDNQLGETVMRFENAILFGRRGVEPLIGKARPQAAKDIAEEGETLPDIDGTLPLPYADEARLEEEESLGRHRFGRAEIVRFAKAYDPQSFHIDEAAARASHFGGLIASGWHTTAIWMRLMLSKRQAGMDAARAAGLPVPQLGPSPGFENLRWLKPVYAGDTLHYTTRLTEARALRSRPGWAMMRMENAAHNQHGERVFEFTGIGMWQTRPV